MSEEAKPEIGEWQASDDGSHIYSDRFETDAMLVLSGDFGSVAKRKRYADQIAHDLSEAAALRAALHQERADNERLRAFAQHVRSTPTPISRFRMNSTMRALGLLDDQNKPTALLSGRGEKESPH